jgi:hypothetical protein
LCISTGVMKLADVLLFHFIFFTVRILLNCHCFNVNKVKYLQALLLGNWKEALNFHNF